MLGDEARCCILRVASCVFDASPTVQMYARLIKEFGYGHGSTRATSFLRQLRLVNFEPDGACVFCPVRVVWGTPRRVL
jgi:hypothetical protein